MFRWASGQNGSIQPSTKAKAVSTTNRLSAKDKGALQAFLNRDDETWLTTEATTTQIEQAATYRLVDASFKNLKMAEALQQV